MTRQATMWTGLLLWVVALPACATPFPSFADPPEGWHALSPAAAPAGQDKQEPEPENDKPDASTHEGINGSINVLLGWRGLDDAFWNGDDDHALHQMEVTIGHSGFPLALEFGLAYSYSTFDDTDAGLTIEAYAGSRLTFLRVGRIHPYVGAGISFIYAERDQGIPFLIFDDDEDTSAGGYVHGGVLFDITKQVHLGVDVRYLYGSDLELFGVDTDADYLQVAMVVGFHF